MKLPKIKVVSFFTILICLLATSLIIAPSKILGFEEYFDGTELNENIWQYYENGGQIEVSDGFVNLSSSAATFPYIYTKQNPFPETGDFQIKIKMQYTSLTLRGGGVVIGNFIPPNTCSVPYYNSHDKEITLFAILQDSFKHLRVIFVPCRNIDECEDEHSVPLQLEEDNTELNEFQIIYTESRYKLLFNDTLVFTSNETPRRPTALYIGNPTFHGHSYPWSSFRVDSIEIFPPFPTPSPDPIVLLPGLGASWNHEDMILGIHKEPEDWYMTPFVKTYDGIIQTLKNAGYEDAGDNKNLFIFNYDWRQPIETIANQLNDYIENTVDPPPETKIDLIGHSLGGMVARTYVQNKPDHQVDQLITIGSPHKGVPQVYYLWEGADLNRSLQPWQRIGAGILLQLSKRSFENNVKTIQHVIPGLEDLLPVFPYLKQNGVEKPLSEMNERNEWLENLNLPPLPGFLISVFNNIVGLRGDTLRWINVISRNRFDRLLGRWIDGKPVGEEYEMGDLTVLAESAQLEGANVVELSDLDHGELVETVIGQQAIVDLLGLSPSSVVSAPEVSYEPSLVFQLASPASITIFGPDGWQIGEGVENNIPDAIYNLEDKLIVIPNPKEGDYQAHVNKEGDGGEFRLLIGKLLPENDIWQEFEGQTSDEPKIFTTTFSEVSAKNKLELLKLAKQRLESMRNKVLKSRRPYGRFLTSVIKWEIRQINRAIRFLQKGKENHAQRKIKGTISSLIFLEKNLKFWLRFYPPEFQEELQEDLRIAKDYLLQAYEID